MLSIFTRGKHNRAIDKKYKRAKGIWEEQKNEKERQFNYAVEGLKIQKSNLNKNLDFQDASRLQSYNYEVARQQFDFAQDVKIYKRSIEEATGMMQMADLADQHANLQQDRYLFENELSLDLEEQETALNYKFAAAGLALERKKAKASAVSELQKTGIQGLKAAGSAAARGQAGRSAYKNQQAILAETAAVENNIVETLFNANLGIDADLRQLSDQLVMDQTALEFSRKSLKASDKVQRLAFQNKKLEAYMSAVNSIAMKPEMGPPIPKPFLLPRPEFQEVFKPNFEIGKPKKSDFGKKISFGQALFSDAIKVGGAVLAGVTAGASAGAAGAAGGLSSAAGTSGILGMSQTTAVGVGAGLSHFLSNS